MRKLDFDTEKFGFTCETQVRFRDTDAMGHVNNAVYLTYLELGRIEYWKKLMNVRDYRDFHFIVGSAEIEYLSPVQIADETVKVGVRCHEMRGASFDFEYAVWAGQGKRLAAKARTTQVMYDYKTAKPMRIPDEIRNKVAEFEKRINSGA